MQKAHLIAGSRFLAVVTSRTCVATGMPAFSQTYQAREPDFTSKDLSRRIGLMPGQWGGLGRLRWQGRNSSHPNSPCDLQLAGSPGCRCSGRCRGS